MTRARAAVLATLDAATEPLSAAGVVTRLADCCDQATVYRALHHLEETGRAESFVRAVLQRTRRGALLRQRQRTAPPLVPLRIVPSLRRSWRMQDRRARG